jgi:hypothetical protein
MAGIVLRSNGLSITIPFTQQLGFYATKKIDGNKTLYNVVWEKIVNGKEVSASGLAAEYTHVNSFISSQAVVFCVKKIAWAIGQSNDPRVRELKILRAKPGQTRFAKDRVHPRQALGEDQKAVLDGVVRKLHANGIVSNKVICEKAMIELKKQKLHNMVVLSHKTLSRSKERVLRR